MKIFVNVGLGCDKPYVYDTKVEAARAREIRMRSLLGRHVYEFEKALVQSFRDLRRRMKAGNAPEVCRVEA